MVSRANSDDEGLAVAVRLSLLSPDDVNAQAAQPPAGGSAPANDISRRTTLPSDEEDKFEIIAAIFDKRVNRLHRSASTSDEARSSTLPNETDEDDLELASQLPDDIYDEQVKELNRRRESRTAIEDSPASLLMAMSPVEVRVTLSIYLGID
jgi:hypothetical protein